MISILIVSFELCSWFFEHWGQGSNLSRTRPFQAAVASILLYGCTTWTLTKQLEKKLDGNYTRMLRAILNKSWRQHPTRHQLYSHLPPITKTIQVRRTRHAGHCWRSRDELISDVLLWTPTHGRAKASLGIHGFRPIVEVLVTLAKFIQSSGYCIVINCTFTLRTTNVFGCFSAIIV